MTRDESELQLLYHFYLLPRERRGEHVRVRVLESPQGESEHHVVSREDGPAGQHHIML